MAKQMHVCQIKGGKKTLCICCTHIIPLPSHSYFIVWDKILSSSELSHLHLFISQTSLQLVLMFPLSLVPPVELFSFPQYHLQIHSLTQSQQSSTHSHTCFIPLTLHLTNTPLTPLCNSVHLFPISLSFSLSLLRTSVLFVPPQGLTISVRCRKVQIQLSLLV